MRSFKEARRPQATISGIISQKKTSNQKNFHHDGRTSTNTVSGAGFDCAATFAAMGNPQDGQAGASVETGFPHSGQLTNAVAISPHRILGRRTKVCQGQATCKSKCEDVLPPFTTQIAAQDQTSPAIRSAKPTPVSGLPGFCFAAPSPQTTTLRDRPRWSSSRKAVDPPSSSDPFRCHIPGPDRHTCSGPQCRQR